MKYFEILHVFRFPINEIEYNINDNYICYQIIYKICIKFKESITITAKIYTTNSMHIHMYIHNINMNICVMSYLI